MCGADGNSLEKDLRQWGSPPRVRSRRPGRDLDRGHRGITSACAEQTCGRTPGRDHGRDHLRVCGADSTRDSPTTRGQGSPPRVRSRHALEELSESVPGITSACAEQTSSVWPSDANVWDHLRVCGADGMTGALGKNGTGSPPRVRSRQIPPPAVTVAAGITSACAEQTSAPREAAAHTGDHLRVCGADCSNAVTLANPYGSPPRVRSRQVPRMLVLPVVGITSACAEQTIWRTVA